MRWPFPTSQTLRRANSAAVQGGFEAIYDQTVNDALGGTGKETFAAVNYLKKVNPAQYKPENGAQYPRTPFGNGLLQISQLIKAGVGPRDRFHRYWRLGHARE
jgi:hypothetical protein